MVELVSKRGPRTSAEGLGLGRMFFVKESDSDRPLSEIVRRNGTQVKATLAVNGSYAWLPPYFPDLEGFPVSFDGETIRGGCGLVGVLDRERSYDAKSLFKRIGREIPPGEVIGELGREVGISHSSCKSCFQFGYAYYCTNPAVISRYLAGFQDAGENAKR